MLDIIYALYLKVIKLFGIKLCSECGGWKYVDCRKGEKTKNNPNQPIGFDEQGIIRFKENKIIGKMLDICTENGFSLNEISCDDITTKDDYKQLMQLVGYSISGYQDLGVCSDKEYYRTQKKVNELLKSRRLN